MNTVLKIIIEVICAAVVIFILFRETFENSITRRLDRVTIVTPSLARAVQSASSAAMKFFLEALFSEAGLRSTICLNQRRCHPKSMPRFPWHHRGLSGSATLTCRD